MVKGIRWFDWILMATSALFLAFFCFDLHHFLTSDPRDYPIGWEPGGWAYRTRENYTIHGLMWCVIASAGIAGQVVRSKKALLYVARFLGLYMVSIFCVLQLLELGMSTGIIEGIDTLRIGRMLFSFDYGAL